MQRWCGCGLVLLMAAARAAAPDTEHWQIDSALIDESSGLARSQLREDLLWTHNDSGGRAELYAIDTGGHYLGALRVAHGVNTDWEDIASFVEDGQPRLLVADIGDNFSLRPFVTLYVIAEPELPTQRPFSIKAAPLRALQVRYPNGPRDAEAAAVDAREGTIYLLTKRAAAPELYRVPLKPADPHVIAEPLGPINLPQPQPQTRRDRYITALDFNPAGTQAVVLTLTHAYLYRRAPGEPWQAALARTPIGLTLPAYRQIEGVTFSRDGAALWISSEGVPMPLAWLPVP